MLKIRTLIVDDEPFARQKVRNMLRDDPDVEIAGECENGWDALADIRELQPDLVFMDMLMPEKSGLEVLRELDENTAPYVVFITAHNDFALQAFETHALDYLLKPFDYGRFQKALHRARTQIQLKQNRDIHQQLSHLLRQVAIQTGYLDRLMLKSGEEILFLKTAEIDWIEAAGNYVNLHLGKKAYLYRETMNHLEQQLDPRKFVRIHRSRIVNVERICKLQSWSHGEYVIIMKDDTELLLTRTYRENLLGLFERPAS